MSNGRYTGPSAREAKEDRRAAASDTLDILYRSPEEIVNEIVAELGLGPEYLVGGNGRVSSGYASTSPAERAAATEQIQRELVGKCRERMVEKSEQPRDQRKPQPQRKNGPRRRVRFDRIAVVGGVLTVLTLLGYGTVKSIITGVKGDPEIGGKLGNETSKSDSLTPGKDESSRESVEVIPDGGETSEESPYTAPNLRLDETAYVIDFMDYYNPSQKENINQMLDQGMIDGLGIRIGGSKMDYPFTIKNFTDEEINNDLNWFVETGRLELDHQYGLEVAQAEEFILKSPVTIPYYLTCAVNFEEAEIEATCIEATYKKMEKDMPGYDFKNRMAPITIDIEHCGDEKSAKGEDYIAQIGAMNQRKEAVLHLIDCLREKGIIDERGVIIYGDLNRMKDQSQIDWDGLFQGLEDRNINTVKWGTRAIAATYNDPSDPDAAVKYDDIYAFKDALMNTATNISYMKKYYDKEGDSLRPYLKDVAIQQIHLDQQMKTPTYGEKYDVNITTLNTLDAIVHGYSIDYSKDFIDRIEEVRMKEVQKDLHQQGDNQAENYVPNNNIDDGDR